MPRIDSKRLPLRLKRWLTLLRNNGFKFSGFSKLFILQNEISYITQLTKPQQAPTSSIPGIQVCQSCAGAVLHAQHLTFLEFHTSVRLLWAASRKYNFNLHVLESKAQDAEDRLETVASQAQKMAEIVTKQWIQIPRLEQALHITPEKKKKNYLSPPPVA
ncbi:uncharacterized protein Pyn_23917 [Prunus yedoensis var. nudiflora]|uniref:Uncharacterized protein n=1 Tax=Prunus yedoensis var. nudiflora TaxID=2094558 RepID=A0A314XLF6_PRUYE|nr:uncharacterized protein Pyn_23917 [Prunus yedoensis var. nudiflora]